MRNLHVHFINCSIIYSHFYYLINIHKYIFLDNLHIGPLSKHDMHKH